MKVKGLPANVWADRERFEKEEEEEEEEEGWDGMSELLFEPGTCRWPCDRNVERNCEGVVAGGMKFPDADSG
jgi:hypothetical protein